MSTYSPKVLIDGQWVRRGPIWTWVDAHPERAYKPRQNAPACPKCHALLRRDQTCRYCIRPIVFAGRPVCHCGCLLAYADEDCPNCRAQLLEVAA